MATGAAANTSATFGLNLESNIPSVTTGVAASLEQLRMAFVADTSALRGLQEQMATLKGSGQASAESLKALSARISAQKQLTNSSRQAYLGLGSAFDKTKPKAAAASSSFAELNQALSSASGPLAQVISKGKGLGAMLLSWPGLLIATAAGMVAITAAAGAAAAAITAFGIASANARRDESLRLEGLSKYRNFWQEMIGMSRKADSGAFLQKTIDSVSGSVALARGEVSGLTSELYRAGLRGGNLQAAVEGASIVLATQGEAGASQFKSLALNAALYGGSVKKLSDYIKARLGGIAKAQMLSLGTQTLKLKENLAAIFGGLKLDGFLGALKAITDQFSQQTVLGHALKTLAETMLQPLLDWVASKKAFVLGFFDGLVIGAYLFSFALLDLRDALKNTFVGTVIDNLFATNDAMNLGALAASVLAGAIIGTVVAAGLLVAPFVLAGAAIYGAIEAVKDLMAWFDQSKWHKAASDMIFGLVNGILAGFPQAIAAAVGLAKAVSGAFKAELGIHSPSRVLFEDGANTAKGAELGMRQGTPGVEQAATEMAVAARPKALGQGAAAAGAAEVATSAALTSLTINFADRAVVIEVGDKAAAGDMMVGLKAGIVELIRSAVQESLVTP